MDQNKRVKWTIIFAVIVVATFTAAFLLMWQKSQNSAYLSQNETLATEKLNYFQTWSETFMNELTAEMNGQAMEVALNETSLRSVSRQHPKILQAFLVNQSGVLIYPNKNAAMTASEAAFVQRTAMLWQDNELLSRINLSSQAANERTLSKEPPKLQGWLPWFSHNRLELLYWKRVDDKLLGFELNGARLLADLISTFPSQTTANELLILSSTNDDVLHQWGNGSLINEPVITSTKLPAPLSNWTIQFKGQVLSKSLIVSIGWVLLVAYVIFVFAIIMAALFIYNSYQRAYRLAEQRVSFVNQVSHELKTPLTNIQLYSDMLNDQLETTDAEDSSVRYVNVIQEETKRLTRLVNNVLSLARQDRNKLQCEPKITDVGILLSKVGSVFQPLLLEKNMHLTIKNDVTESINIDPHCIEQVMNNLLGNAEKYAGENTIVNVSAKLDANTLVIDVMDNGRGIPKQFSKRVFERFFRINDKHTEGVSGTGIGLSISSELAKCHGGSLVLVSGENGAHFQLKVAIQ